MSCIAPGGLRRGDGGGLPSCICINQHHSDNEDATYKDQGRDHLNLPAQRKPRPWKNSVPHPRLCHRTWISTFIFMTSELELLTTKSASCYLQTTVDCLVLLPVVIWDRLTLWTNFRTFASPFFCQRVRTSTLTVGVHTVLDHSAKTFLEPTFSWIRSQKLHPRFWSYAHWKSQSSPCHRSS